MRYRLRTLLIWVMIGPPILALAFWYPIAAAFAGMFLAVATLPRSNLYP